MSELQASFVELALRGDVTADDIDDFIDDWHDGLSELPLHSFLGMTTDEYALWVRWPEALETILEQRRRSVEPPATTHQPPR